ncbi:hypothetical protein LO762_14485 [Actinocorallia sp. API 0066]|uniref:hypothetical protein n=1 Tax=Actinocorallia sp. API 0066 TaxID=2896846 RepID=UPI001E650CA6|nr:hypothetical protein [Actinocorallia sp. API 0066]MCD0450390.1 hypothetical protein [Actinocorallia sp. API 0066]
MKEFAETALGMPTVVFSVLLFVVVLYWVLAIVGLDVLADDTDLLGVLGLRGVPTSVIISLFVAVAWFLSLAGSVWLGSNPLVPLGAVAGGWLAARLLINPLRYVLPEAPVTSRHDFVGRLCVVRTGTVTERFGQAEVTAPDGGTALLQVRRTGDEPLGTGDTALIFDYDDAGEFFWVMPYDAALDPHQKDV